MSKSFLRYSVVFIIILTTTYVLYSGEIPNFNLQGQIQLIKPKKIILMATPFFGHPYTNPTAFAACPHYTEKCTLSQNPEDIANASAVVFHSRDFYRRINNTRKYRIPHVWWTLESPINERVGGVPKDFIDWTFTYRQDSDIDCPYAHLVRRGNVAKQNLSEIWAMKSEEVGWMVSNCHASNRRNEIAKALNTSGLSVHVYGSCGRKPKCVKDNVSRDCGDEIIRRYKFYLAFENSNCKDYVTEKFYKALQIYKAVPIVIKRKIYENLGIPANSFIALDDFNSTTELAKFLHELAQSRNRYLVYHAWRTEYDITLRDGFCRLCDRIHAEPSYRSTGFRDIQKFWSKDVCDQNYAQKFLH